MTEPLRTERDHPAFAGRSRFVKNSAFGTIAGLSTALGSFFTSVIVAHLGGVAETGIFAFALWIVVLVTTTADFGIHASLSRYLPELIGKGERDQARRLTGFLVRFALAGSLAAAIGFGFYAGYAWRAGALSDGEAIRWLAIGIACGLQVLAAFGLGYLRGTEQFKRIALLAVLSLVLQLTGVAGGELLFGIPGALVGYCAGSVPAAIFILSLTRPAPRLAPELRTRVVRYALYAWAAGLASAFVWSRVEVFFLQRSVGDEAVGLFTVALTLSNLAVQGPMLLTAGLLPHFAGRFGASAFTELHGAFASATRILAFLVLPAGLLLAATMPVVLPLIFSHAFADAIPAATVLCVAGAVAATASVGSNLIYAMDRSDFVFASGLAAAALSIFAGIVVIPAFGLAGAAWARAVIQIAAVALGGWFISQRLRCPVPFRELARLLLASVLSALAAAGCLWLIPGTAALAAAIPAGIVSYIAAVRLLRALPADDIERLYGITGRLPRLLQEPGAMVLRLLARPAVGHTIAAE